MHISKSTTNLQPIYNQSTTRNGLISFFSQPFFQFLPSQKTVFFYQPSWNLGFFWLFRKSSKLFEKKDRAQPILFREELRAFEKNAKENTGFWTGWQGGDMVIIAVCPVVGDLSRERHQLSFAQRQTQDKTGLMPVRQISKPRGKLQWSPHPHLVNLSRNWWISWSWFVRNYKSVFQHFNFTELLLNIMYCVTCICNHLWTK